MESTVSRRIGGDEKSAGEARLTSRGLMAASRTSNDGGEYFLNVAAYQARSSGDRRAQKLATTFTEGDGQRAVLLAR
jgi:hypothetical protein